MQNIVGFYSGNSTVGLTSLKILLTFFLQLAYGLVVYLFVHDRQCLGPVFFAI
jgi:hypothetical protein